MRRYSPVVFTCVAGLAMLGLMTGCSTYDAKPIDLAASAQALQSRALNDAPLRQRLLELHLLSADQAFPLAEWDRAQLLVAAVERNAEVLQAQQKLQLALAGVTTAHALPNPTLTLGSEYSLSQTSESPWLWSISTDWLLDVGLRRQLRIRLADVAVRAARRDYAETLWSVRTQLRTALLSLLINEQRLMLLDQTVASEVRLQAKQQQLAKVGEASSGEVLTSTLELARLRGTLLDAQTQHSSAQAQLAKLLGLPISSLQAQHFGWSDLLQVTDVDAAQLTAWREQALLSRGDLEQAVLGYASAELELRQAIRQQYPQLSIGPGYTWDHGVKKATLGLAMTLPLFSRNQGPIAEALARRDLAGEQVLAVQAQVLNEIDAAQAAYRDAVVQLQTQLEQSDAAESLLQQRQHALHVGAVDRVEVITAELLLNVQQLAVLDRVEHLQQVLGQLEEALRRPLSGPEMQLNAAALDVPETVVH